MRSLPFLSVLLFTVSSVALAAPTKSTLSMADWHVAPMTTPGGTSNYCAMATRYSEGPIVTFTRNAKQKGTIAVDFRNAALEKGQKYAVTLRVADRNTTYGANAISKTQLVLNIGDDTNLIEAMNNGETMTVSLDGTPGIYKLAGNKRAFYEFAHCVKALAPVISATETVMAAPAPTPQIVTQKIAPPQPAPEIAAAPVIPMATFAPALVERKSLKNDVIFEPAPALFAQAQVAPAPTPKFETVAAPIPKPAKPMKLARPKIETPKPVAAKIEPAAGIETRTILWDPVSTPQPVPAPKIAFEPTPEKIPAAPVAETKTPPPAPKMAMDDSAQRLKSSLAKARAQAAEKAAAPTAPAPREELARIQAPAKLDTILWDDPVTIQSASKAPIVPVVMEQAPAAPKPKKYKPLPPADIEITPIKPPAPKTGRVVPLKPQNFGNTPIIGGEIRELPAPDFKPGLSVSADPAPTAMPSPMDYNTVIPSMGHPASAPVAKTAPKPARKMANFRPTPAASASTWKTRLIESDSGNKENNFCLMENKYDNDTLLMIGQRADGQSTLGINYGIDMLEPKRDYKVTVQLDGEFEETFIAYAENAQVLVIEMGKKKSFFDLLDGAQAMRVAMPGTASSFAVQNLASGLEEFSNCLTGIGGEKITTQLAEIALEPMPAAPIAKVTEYTLIAPQKHKDVPPQPLETIAPVPVAAMPKAAAPKPRWSDETRAMLFGLGLAEKPGRVSEDHLAWQQAAVSANVRRLGTGEALDAATTLLDEAERNCDGSFTSQIGLPEEANGVTTILMESKCAKGNTAAVSTWLVERRDGQLTGWQFTAAREQRAEAFRQRDAVQNALADMPADIHDNRS